jgi:hypothetical protein
MPGSLGPRILISRFAAATTQVAIAAACGGAATGRCPQAPARPEDRSARVEEVCTNPELIPAQGAFAAFIHEGKRCGCFKGKLFCTDLHSPTCFAEGRWYWPPELREDVDRMIWQCRKGVWVCAGGKTLLTDLGTGPANVTFPLGDAEHPHPGWIDMYATALQQHPEVRLIVIGQVNPREGNDAKALARRRAELVRDQMIARGIAPNRLSIGDLEAAPLEELGSVLLRRAPEPDAGRKQ